MTTAHAHHIHAQLEPDEVIRTGTAKRYKPLFIQKWEAMEAMRVKLGNEEFARRIAEDEQRQREEYYDE